MSPRSPVLLGPTSAERRGLDTGRGRDGREEIRGGAKLAGGVSLRLLLRVLSEALSTTFPRSLDRGVCPGWEDDGRTSSI